MEQWMDLSGKVIIVTGGSQGIGEHVVRTLRDNKRMWSLQIWWKMKNL